WNASLFSWRSSCRRHTILLFPSMTVRVESTMGFSLSPPEYLTSLYSLLVPSSCQSQSSISVSSELGSLRAIRGLFGFSRSCAIGTFTSLHGIVRPFVTSSSTMGAFAQFAVSFNDGPFWFSCTLSWKNMYGFFQHHSQTYR